MAKASIKIITEGMRQMENDFGLLATGATVGAAKERLTELSKIGVEGVHAALPVDQGDKRRPAGTLRDSLRYELADVGDTWEITVMVGTEDDAVPYAKWVLYKNIHKPGGDYLEPMAEFEDRMPEAMNTAFDAVFGEG